MTGITVKKNKKETTQALIRRFVKAVRESGSLHTVKLKRFRDRPKSELKKKLLALRRIQKQKEALQKEKYGF